MGLFRWIVAGIGLETGRKVVNAVDDLRQQRQHDEQLEEQRRSNEKRRNIAIVVASLVGLVLLAGLFFKLLRWAVALMLLAALGYVIWAYLGPRLQAAAQRLRARGQERRAQAQTRRAEDARKEGIEQALDDIKKDLGAD